MFKLTNHIFKNKIIILTKNKFSKIKNMIIYYNIIYFKTIISVC